MQVTKGLWPYAAGCVNQHQTDVCARGGNRHVAGVLLVARSICDYQASSVAKLHRSVGNIDCDALLALCFETVGQQAEVDLAFLDG